MNQGVGNESESAFKSTRVAVVGASGYSGEALVRLLLLHPRAELVAVTSRQYAGRRLSEVFRRFGHLPQADALYFSEPDVSALAEGAEVVFLALPHGVAVELAGPLLEKGCVVIDLSADFRVHDAATYEEFYGEKHAAPHLLPSAVYGLPERHRDAIRRARLIASPGCYPTGILLPALPLLAGGLVDPDSLVANSLSGVSGAGRKVDSQFLFVECNESVRPYGVPKHRHLSEIEQELSEAAGRRTYLQFTPHLIPISQGILTTLYMSLSGTDGASWDAAEAGKAIDACFRRAYAEEPFVRLLGEEALPDTKEVVGTNMVEIGWRLDRRTGRLVVFSAEDNLLKGASGQAVQSFNLVSGYPETLGLVY